MLCVTGNERDVDALVARLARVPAGALAELRLDALAPGQQQAALALVERYGPQLVVCCRPTRQGGSFDGDEATRLELLKAAAQRGAGVVDLEGDCDDKTLERLRESLGPGARALLSWHDFVGFGPELGPKLCELERRDVELTKLAVSLDEPADLSRLLDLRDELTKPAVLLAMGSAGQLSRARYTRLGSPWTYVCEQSAAATASGQLTLDDAHALALHEGSSDAPFLALIGGPSVAASPGPAVYNRWFRARGLPWAYHAIQTAAPERCVALLARLGALGLAVTMPHKLAALNIADEVDERARRAGAANTLLIDDTRLRATNTDIAGVRDPLARALDQRSAKRALVLGAGGAARAAALACAELGLQVSCSARRREMAEALPAVEACLSWDRRQEASAELLINATALGGERSPWPEEHALSAAVVFDLALDRAPSRLLSRAREAGAMALDAREMWVAQGAAQLRHVATVAPDDDARRALAGARPEELRALLEERPR
jgi:shikimate dehydrogenase/3-dehydroquinate dehydratase type I